MPTKDGDMKPTCSVNIAPPMAENSAATQKTKILKFGDVVAGEAQTVLFIPHGNQNAAQLAIRDVATGHHAAYQQDAIEEVEDVLGVIGADIPAVQGPQIGDSVDTARQPLLADNQNGQDGGDDLGDDGEIDAADPPFEHRRAEDEGEQVGTTTIAAKVKGKL